MQGHGALSRCGGLGAGDLGRLAVDERQPIVPLAVGQAAHAGRGAAVGGGLLELRRAHERRPARALEVETRARRRRDRQEPEQEVRPEHGLDVLVGPAVVADLRCAARAAVPLLAELDRGRRPGREPEVQGEERAQQHRHGDRQGHAEHEQEPERRRALLLRRLRDGLGQRRHHSQAGGQRVENEEEEVFVVPEAHAVRDPRAMVVHAEDAGPADAAMVAPVRLELVAPLTEASTAKLLGLADGDRYAGVLRRVVGR
mmetsp:Transcript_115149/g.321874  ORF Transcript_115149/g.321874 Transcript_115149/m.321874 type:complete len:257 (-) Transcript_115149:383-1153(-)